MAPRIGEGSYKYNIIYLGIDVSSIYISPDVLRLGRQSKSNPGTGTIYTVAISKHNSGSIICQFHRFKLTEHADGITDGR
jgi:hypothetical protein